MTTLRTDARSAARHALTKRACVLGLLVLPLLIVQLNTGVWADMIGHGGLIRSIAVSPDGTLALTGSFDSTVRVWRFDGEWVPEWHVQLDP